MIDKTTVSTLDIEKYMGTWYEIARFDHPFERNLVGVTATYSILPNGKVQVINAGYKNSLNGSYSTAKAKAKIPNASKPGNLKVYFIPFFGAEYNILELDTNNYQWALVGSSSASYLWILSRTKTMDPEVYNKIITTAKTRGYNTDKLILIPQ
jgi:lipocalin